MPKYLYHALVQVLHLIQHQIKYYHILSQALNSNIYKYQLQMQTSDYFHGKFSRWTGVSLLPLDFLLSIQLVVVFKGESVSIKVSIPSESLGLWV